MVDMRARAIIEAVDKTGKTFSDIAGKMKAVDSAAKALAKGQQVGALTKQVDAVAKSLQKVSAIDAFRGSQASFTSARGAFREAQANVSRLAAEMAKAAKPTAAMSREFAKAQREVKATASAFDQQKTAVLASKRALEQAGVPLAKLAAQEKSLRIATLQTTAALEKRHAAMLRSQGRREVAGGLAAAAGVAGARKVGAGARATLHTYREFDDERRYGKAVMSITDEEQKPLVDQAIHGGATTKYNDIQFLHGQRDLAARGVKKEAILGMMPHAANLGMATSQDLPAAVKMMENAIFTFQKSVGTVDEASASAKQTSDIIVKAMKISGMSPEDIGHAYTFGAPSANMGNLGENNLLTFAGILKKAGIGGDQAGTAFRALTSTIFAPTAGGKTAMRANGLNYADYQKSPDKLAVDPFVDNIASKYGVMLDKKAKAALKKVFEDKNTIADPAKFTPKIMDVLGEHLGGDDAKSKKSIAGEANRYRDASMKGVDSNKMFRDLLDKTRGNIGFANKMFGAKQGSRIATALKDPEVYDKVLKQLDNSEGYAKNISDERMAGFDGAVSRFEGAVKNLETSVGRSWDNDGKGGALTALAGMAGKATQALAELPSGVQQTITAITALGAGVGGVMGALNLAKLLFTGGGLAASATALDASAAALTAAAGRLGVAGAARALPATAAGGAAGLAAVPKIPALVGATLGAYGLYLAGQGNAEKYKDLPVGASHDTSRKGRRAYNEALHAETQKLRATVEGPVTATLDPGSKVDVSVTVKADGATVTSMSATSAGSARASVGTSMGHLVNR